LAFVRCLRVYGLREGERANEEQNALRGELKSSERSENPITCLGHHCGRTKVRPERQGSGRLDRKDGV
jgi:hypothetical protein